MKKNKVIKVQLCEEVRRALETAENDLRTRGVRDIGVSQLVEKILLKLQDRILTEIVDELTPIEYRLKSALQDEKKRRQILKIINSRHAGAEYDPGTPESPNSPVVV